jgi:hypothetical protein
MFSPSRTALASIVAVVAGSACAPQPVSSRSPPTFAATPCTPGICVIEVSVTACDSPGGISVDKPYVSVSDAVNLRWKIVTPGFVFSSSGIAFDPPDAQFEPQFSPHANEFRVQDHKRRSGDFKYFVNVQGCVPLDPWIKNQ